VPYCGEPHLPSHPLLTHPLYGNLFLSPVSFGSDIQDVGETFLKDLLSLWQPKYSINAGYETLVD